MIILFTDDVKIVMPEKQMDFGQCAHLPCLFVLKKSPELEISTTQNFANLSKFPLNFCHKEKVMNI